MTTFLAFFNLIPSINWVIITIFVAYYIFIFIPMICRLFTWLLVFHLSYYNISHRIGILNSFIESLEGQNNSHLRIKRFRTCGYLSDQICLAANNINEAFSFSLIVAFTVLICLSTMSIFFIIYATLSSVIPFTVKNKFSIFIAMFLLSNAMVLLFISSAQSPVNQVMKLNSDSVHKIDKYLIIIII